MPGADDCWTDHRLLITKLKLTIKRKPRNIQQNEARRYDTGKLKDPDTSRAFQAAIQQNLPARELSVDAEWTNIRDAINETARTIIGYQSKQHQDWFDDNDKDIEALINTKRKARIAHDQDPNSQPKWLNMHKQSHSVKPGFVKYKMSGGNKWLKTYKHTAAGTLLAADNTILTEDYEIQNRWVEHFNTLLNRNSSAQQDFLRNVPQHPPQLWMSLPPTFREFDAALKQMRHGKAAGPDNIPTEFLTHGGLVLKTRLHSLILKAWEEKQAPNDWKDALLVTIFKKGDRRESAMLYEVPHNNPGVEIKYRLDGGIFKLARLSSQRNTNTINVTELQYADDNAAVAHTQAELQESVDNFHAAYTCFGLTVNKAKTKILAQPRPGENTPVTNITMDGTTTECVEHFPYLGSILSTQSTSSKEIENRLQAGHTAYGRLSTRVFKNKDLTTHTKEANIDPNAFEASGSNRNEWRRKIKVGTDLSEEERRANLVAKRQQRAERTNQPQPPPTIQCDQIIQSTNWSYEP
ncbi:putative RNA-directed DNA polymerase from mobile element jockey-like [Penaeus vannamei]|uniref:Putative RNA-directed DNA polymerase from mobile element jockey-like n=1 Tax=Penaeus vannamei TaxID=6689 RepID=A0A423S8V7_PENVA|nr:putative RNA-directed DNA polymerase from mobile element jockey-like [Penaeus vannamei]